MYASEYQLVQQTEFRKCTSQSDMLCVVQSNIVFSNENLARNEQIFHKRPPSETQIHIFSFFDILF